MCTVLGCWGVGWQVWGVSYIFFTNDVLLFIPMLYLYIQIGAIVGVLMEGELVYYDVVP